jgi:hypothetical protein
MNAEGRWLLCVDRSDACEADHDRRHHAEYAALLRFQTIE